ncbi:hypothetical protein M9H77_27738 [Catharanthus roseus]|uniref:Uncharacterized protein n=1 Tax=Catharanthus roseus TaxID=4058 RepID=A0ACC0ADK5_CATRO|nr:hypothetical protein M9H77_27738 [Catharanthus roseus]
MSKFKINKNVSTIKKTQLITNNTSYCKENLVKWHKIQLVSVCNQSVRRQLATVKCCAPYCAKRSKRVSHNLRHQLRLQCCGQNAYTKGQYNTSPYPHSRSNQICARAVWRRRQ